MQHEWTDQERSLIKEWAAFCDVRRLSRGQQSKLLRVAGSTLSQLHNCSYPGRVPGIQERMQRHMRRERMRESAPSAPPYATTSVTEEVIRAINIAHTERVIVLLLGPTGVGKTMGIHRYCQAEPETILVTAGIGCSPWAITRELAGRLGQSWQGSVYNMRLQIADDLRGTRRLVIVDEIDYVKEPVVQVLRQIQEDAGVGMVWAGTEAYLRRLRARKSSTIRQVLGRIKHAVHLARCTDDDLAGILAPYDLSDEALEALVEGACGEARRAVNAMVAAKRLNGKGISAATIRRAYETLMPVEE